LYQIVNFLYSLNFIKFVIFNFLNKFNKFNNSNYIEYSSQNKEKSYTWRQRLLRLCMIRFHTAPHNFSLLSLMQLMSVLGPRLNSQRLTLKILTITDKEQRVGSFLEKRDIGVIMFGRFRVSIHNCLSCLFGNIRSNITPVHDC
jgi:hypothetical protein